MMISISSKCQPLAGMLFVLAGVCMLAASPAAAHDEPGEEDPKWSIAIHGGAGTIARENTTPQQRAQYEAALQTALDAGADVLRGGGASVDAVKAAIVILEDNPLFNAGRGAVFTWDEENELDASIMDGRDRSAGAVSGVKSIKNPVLLADTVRTDSPHVFLSGEGAESFANDKGLETAPPEWFATEGRKKSLERMKANALSSLDVDLKFGTVGAVALDQDGNLAAGTSTGGMTGKRWGRIGDSPVIGAGTYADNRSCALSATGWGEYFIRVGVAHEVCARLRMEVSGWTIYAPAEDDIDLKAYTLLRAQAIADSVMAEVKELGGDGGIILVTPSGDALYSFNTSGMYRGRATSAGVNEVAIFADSAAETAEEPESE